MYRIEMRSKALKNLETLSPDIQKRILQKLEFYASSSSPLVFAHPLKNSSGLYRFRVGDWRIIFVHKEEVLVIYAIGHRSEIYKK